MKAFFESSDGIYFPSRLVSLFNSGQFLFFANAIMDSAMGIVPQANAAKFIVRDNI
jgi:hypothetical protein